MGRRWSHDQIIFALINEQHKAGRGSKRNQSRTICYRVIALKLNEQRASTAFVRVNTSAHDYRGLLASLHGVGSDAGNLRAELGRFRTAVEFLLLLFQHFSLVPHDVLGEVV